MKYLFYNTKQNENENKNEINKLAHN